MKVCRNCAHYRIRVNGDVFCHLTGAPVGALWQRECFTEKEQKTMEEIKTTKVCKDCGRELPLSEFSHHPKSKDGVNGICKECMTKKQKGAHTVERKGVPLPFVEVEDVMPPQSLVCFTDDQVINELRRRGYSGTITKQFTI